MFELNLVRVSVFFVCFLWKGKLRLFVFLWKYQIMENCSYLQVLLIWIFLVSCNLYD